MRDPWERPTLKIIPAQISGGGAIPDPRSIQDLIQLVKRLRTECPWDRAQTPESVARCLVEEAQELLEGVASWDSIEEEIGDLLYTIVALVVMAEESGRFGLEEVLDLIIAKLIRRHPHVFVGPPARDEREAQALWDKAKAEERRPGTQDRPREPPPGSGPKASSRS